MHNAKASAKKRRILTIIAAFFLLLSFPLSSFAEWPVGILKDSGVKMLSEIYLLADADSGDIILSKNATRRTSPASLAKIATAAVVLEECDDLTKRVTIKQSDFDPIYGTNSSTSGLKAGETRTIYELLACLLIPSGNDAAVILARYVSNDISKFVEKMNEFAKKTGCTNTKFLNPHGLDEDGQYTTAADVLKMTMKAMEYSAFAEITAMREYTLPKRGDYPERIIQTTNRLTNPYITDYYTPYAAGIKTGTTEEAGHCFVSFARHNGYSYYTVVMRGSIQKHSSGDYDINTSFTDTKALFDWAFEKLRLVKICSPLDVIYEVPLLYCSESDIMALCPSEEVYRLVPDGIDASGLLIRAEMASVPESFNAPVEKGLPTGFARVYYANEEITTIELVTRTDARRSSFLYAIKLFTDVVTSLPFLLLLAVLSVLLAGYIAFTLHKRKKNRTPRPIAMGVSPRKKP